MRVLLLTGNWALAQSHRFCFSDRVLLSLYYTVATFTHSHIFNSEMGAFYTLLLEERERERERERGK